jgi:hypothetical protein
MGMPTFGATMHLVVETKTHDEACDTFYEVLSNTPGIVAWQYAGTKIPVPDLDPQMRPRGHERVAGPALVDLAGFDPNDEKNQLDLRFPDSHIIERLVVVERVDRDYFRREIAAVTAALNGLIDSARRRGFHPHMVVGLGSGDDPAITIDLD